MTRVVHLEPEFVDFVPDELEPGTLYISIPYGTAQHSCCCGCGIEVVTPLHPVKWSLVYDGETVSLYPSVGNSGLPCESHYWVRRNEVIWARGWSRDEIEEGRQRDRHAAAVYFAEGSKATGDPPTTRSDRLRVLQRVYRRARRRRAG